MGDSLLLFLQTRFQVMEDLLQLLLPYGQTSSHLLSLCTQLCLCLELLLKSLLLSIQLAQRAIEVRVSQDDLIHIK